MNANWGRTCLCFTLWCILEAQSKDPIIVNIPNQGKVIGKEVFVTRSQKAIAYLGLPFAEPPTSKKHRFAPPMTRNMKTWSDVFEATKYEKACLQDLEELKKRDLLYSQTIFEQEIQFSEDCLYLNVFVPDGNPPSEGWPVMVWFHPGDFIVGTTATWDGSTLAVKQKVIIVTPAYRLNIFGFLSLNDASCPGNVGLLDQVAALDWVSSKISAFNGSTDNICIFGQDSGGISVGLHVLSPLSAGKFQKAIAMSGNALVPSSVRSFKVQEEAWNELSIVFDCQRGGLLACLRNVGPDLAKVKLHNVWGPVVDGDIFNVTQAFLPSHPLTLLKEERINKVPLMIGYTNMEDAMEFIELFQNHEKGMTQNEYTDYIEQTILSDIEMIQLEDNGTCLNSQHIVDSVTFFYSLEPMSTDSTLLRQKYMDFKTEKLYAAGAYQQAMYNSKSRPTYLYRFDYRPQKNIIDIPDWVQVSHGLELPFVWGMPYWTNLPNQNKWISADKKIVDYIMSLWTNFAKYNNPAQSSLNVKWDPFEEDNPTIMIINRGFNLEDSATKFDFKKFTFWNDYYPKVLEAAGFNECCKTNNTGSYNVNPFPAFLIFSEVCWIFNTYVSN